MDWICDTASRPLLLGFFAETVKSGLYLGIQMTELKICKRLRRDSWLFFVKASAKSQSPTNHITRVFTRLKDCFNWKAWIAARTFKSPRHGPSCKVAVKTAFGLGCHYPDTDDTARSACCIKSLMSLSTPAPFNSDQRRRVRKLLSSDSIIAWISASWELMATRRSFQVFHAIMVMGPGSPWRSSGPLRKVIRLPVDEPSGRLLCAWSPSPWWWQPSAASVELMEDAWRSNGQDTFAPHWWHAGSPAPETSWVLGQVLKEVGCTWPKSKVEFEWLTTAEQQWLLDIGQFPLAEGQIRLSKALTIDFKMHQSLHGLGWSRCDSHWSLASP